MKNLRSFPKIFLSHHSIISPISDLILTSGLSILVMSLVVFYYIFNPSSSETSIENILPKILILQALINWPHFIASYRLLYGKKQNFIDFPVATTVVPLLLVIFCVGSAMPVFGGDGPLSLNVKASYFLWLFSSLYLAWHYVGQTWGVMSIYMRISGSKFEGYEHHVIRFGLYSLILWHVVWGSQSLPNLPILYFIQNPITQTAAFILVICAFTAGSLTFLSKLKKSKVDIRVLGAWISIYFWYLVLFLVPAAFPLVQLSHALQYLIFPARIEANRNRSATHPGSIISLRLMLLYLGSIVIGILVFYVPDFLFSGQNATPTLAGMLAISVNIHHYYTDSAIWKSRKNGIKKDLFTHIT